MKKLLLIAFHFPPYGGGSGVHRASKFARYLQESGWHPHVLTASSRAYEKVDPNLKAGIPDSVSVTRAFALDAQRHLAVGGRYLHWSAIPDRWASWALSAIPKGLVALYKKKIDVILVTFPIATAVLIGLVLHRITGKPLVVDFRDSMTEKDYPRDPLRRAVYVWIEKSVIKSGSRFIFTTPSTRQMYLDRYPGLAPSNCVVIQNGYDEDDFSNIAVGDAFAPQSDNGRVRLVHAGLIYPDDRDPRAFFSAVQNLKRQGLISAENLTIDLRASGSEEYYLKLVRELGIDDVIHLLPGLPHREALRDTANADGLLLFQAGSCNHQIPAKAYEYLRLAKPILALTPPTGDTAALFREVGGATIVDLSDEKSITATLPDFVTAVRKRMHPLPQRQKVQRYTRRNGTSELAHCLDQMMGVDIARVASGS